MPNGVKKRDSIYAIGWFSLLFLLVFASCSNPPSESKTINLSPLIAEKKYDEAVAVLNRELIEHPREPNLLYDLAALQRIQGNIAEAKKNALKAKNLAPKDDSIQLLLAEIALDQGRVNEAWDGMQNLGEVSRHEGHAQFILGLIYSYRKNWAQAENCFRAAAQTADGLASAKAALAYVAIQQRRIEEGKAYLLEAEAQAKSSPDAIRQIAECYLELANASKALALAQTLTADYSTDARTWSLIGRAEMILLRFSEAESAFTRALASPNATPWVLVEYATLLFAAQREDEALAKAKEAESQLQAQGAEIQSPALFNLMATLYARKDQMILAHKYLLQSLKIASNQPRIYELLKKLTPEAASTSTNPSPVPAQPTAIKP